MEKYGFQKEDLIHNLYKKVPLTSICETQPLMELGPIDGASGTSGDLEGSAARDNIPGTGGFLAQVQNRTMCLRYILKNPWKYQKRYESSAFL